MAEKVNTEQVSVERADIQDESSVEPELSTKLMEYIKGKPSDAFIAAEIARFTQSAEYKAMCDGENYYNMKTKIDTKQRTVLGVNGETAVDAGILSNTKLKHAHMFKLTRQKVTYLLGKPFSIVMDEENQKLQEILENEYFTPQFRKSIMKTASDAVKEGKSWIQAYIDDEARIKFKFIKGKYIKVYWADDERTEVVAVMKMFKQLVLGADGKVSEQMNVEFYNQKGVYYFTYDAKTGKSEPTKMSDADGNYAPYFYYRDKIMQLNKETGEQEPVMETDADGNSVPKMSKPKPGDFGIVPFIPIRYNDEEMPLLTFIKEKVDDYDEITSGVSDFIKDIPSAIKVVKGYSGTKTGQFVKNLATYRTIFVGDTGGVENLESTMDTAAFQAHLDRTKEDIYSDGSGLDVTKTDKLGQATGVALKFLFQDLDSDCRNLWVSIDEALHKLFMFMCLDMDQRGLGTFYDAKIEFVPNNDALVNEAEVISNLNTSLSMLSQKTILANHPYVKDVNAEIEQVNKERKKAFEDYAAAGDATNATTAAPTGGTIPNEDKKLGEEDKTKKTEDEE